MQAVRTIVSSSAFGRTKLAEAAVRGAEAREAVDNPVRQDADRVIQIRILPMEVIEPASSMIAVLML
jgi:hypothetical protein